MQSYKTERQRQLDNVQKELLTNYYLQKYNSIMSGISKEPENHQKIDINAKPKQSESKGQRMNFKNMILMKKNQNQNSVKRTPKISNQQSQLNKVNLQIVHKYSSREQQQNQKTIKKLEQSIINELYRSSPSKMEQGSYNKLEISNSYHKGHDSTNKKADVERVPQLNIEITYEQDQQVNQFFEDEQEKQRVERVKQAIKLEFQRRKEHSFSPNKNSRKNSDTKSSKISAQIKIESPRKLQKAATPNKYRKFKQSKVRQKGGKRDSSQKSASQNGSQDHDLISQRQRFQSLSSQKKNHQIYFSKDVPGLLNEYQQNLPSYDQVKQEQIDFVPPSSNYYKSQYVNLVEESFKYQEQIRQNKDRDSEKAHSVTSSRKSSRDKKLLKNDSKKSIRSRKKSELKDNSRMEMSFVSKMSMLSSNEGLLIKERIERQLYDNELGPYQSTLFNVIELMEKYPKSGAIYAVGQKTLEDRRAFEQRRIHQEQEIAQLKRSIEKIKKKSQQKAAERQQQAIMGNQLQILRLIRKISTTL